MKRLTTLIALAAGTLSLAAQTGNTIKVLDERSNKEESIGLPPGMLIPSDSLLMQWQLRHFLFPDSTASDTAASQEATPEVYAERLQRLPAVIELPYNNIVQECIDKYIGPMRSSVSVMLGAGNLYIPMLEEILDRNGLPLELKYLPVVESSFNPAAVSPDGPAGLWQFTLSTAKRYGLEVNSLVDERRDPVKSTEAAVRYLKDLYAIYGDWNLVIAAYNCGPETLQKAIHQADGQKDYWTIYPFLPTATRGYVPAFIAANYIMNYYCEHGIRPARTGTPVKTDTITVSRDLHMQQIEALCGIDVAAIKDLNPQYRTEVIPGKSKPRTLRLPQEKMLAFVDCQDSVYNYRAAELLTRRALVAVDEKSVAKVKELTKAKYVTVRRGDTLGAIARRNRTTISAIKRLNGMRSDRINPGKRLRVK